MDLSKDLVAASATPLVLAIARRRLESARVHSFYNDFASGSKRRVLLLLSSEYTYRAPGFVPVANVQLLIGTSAVLCSFVMASSVLRCSMCN